MIRHCLAAALVAGAFILPGSAAADGHLLSEKVPSGTYMLDPNHGYVTFSYSHLGFSNPQLRFGTVHAEIELNADEPTSSGISVSIPVDSIDSGVEVFDGHLRGDRWFNAAEFADITFVSTELTQTDEGTGTLTGDLTIKGITKPVTLDVELIAAGEHPAHKKDTVGVNATGMVLRSDFDLGAFAPAVSDEVTIAISGEFNLEE